MLEQVTLKLTENSEIRIPASGVTIFVGPNNSGKSLTLREIEKCFNVHPFPSDNNIVSGYNIRWPEQNDLDAFIEFHSMRSPAGMGVGQIQLSRMGPLGREMMHTSIDTINSIWAAKTDSNWWLTQIGKWGIVRLDGRSRFDLTNDQPGGDLLGIPSNILNYLFQNDAARKKVRNIIHDAFGTYLVIDPMLLGTLRIRLSSEKPPTDEQSLGEAARSFYKNASLVKELSDGIQAFTGIITALVAGDFHTILIDEPEAFLHPPLAKKLGRHLSSLAKERGGVA